MTRTSKKYDVYDKALKDLQLDWDNLNQKDIIEAHDKLSERYSKCDPTLVENTYPLNDDTCDVRKKAIDDAVRILMPSMDIARKTFFDNAAESSMHLGLTTTNCSWEGKITSQCWEHLKGITKRSITRIYRDESMKFHPDNCGAGKNSHPEWTTSQCNEVFEVLPALKTHLIENLPILQKTVTTYVDNLIHKYPMMSSFDFYTATPEEQKEVGEWALNLENGL